MARTHSPSRSARSQPVYTLPGKCWCTHTARWSHFSARRLGGLSNVQRNTHLPLGWYPLSRINFVCVVLEATFRVKIRVSGKTTSIKASVWRKPRPEDIHWWIQERPSRYSTPPGVIRGFVIPFTILEKDWIFWDSLQCLVKSGIDVWLFEFEYL